MWKLLLGLLLLGISSQLWAQSVTHAFELGDDNFLLDGKPFQMISGEMHYLRVPRQAWGQRLRMAKAATTWWCWNCRGLGKRNC
ncbi:beta-galactosidase [Hymenobacter cellulosivorans]|uniref:Beta-galactosidase n=1 Tax=Hymenobacter cellulosivorans TaxID=2932249 RepID=A0ABY4FCS7_9BACT|nr:beta-galactosidase [Hymenobacter cellulosivorans]UOQ53774.1 beta-galactosidase [Hymenobacter cellulosivorans]